MNTKIIGQSSAYIMFRPEGKTEVGEASGNLELLVPLKDNITSTCAHIFLFSTEM